MSKITLKVSNENLDRVLMVLESLKAGLIENIEVDKSLKTHKPTYQPKINKVIKENEVVSGKYIDPASFKKRLNKTQKN
ncbi:hypothetical protein [Sulfurospirillum arcachonense]|uniref:hypothetical protein n=1 Tax=Sulfurospirillum arcachonense TaxID=57666 RepID=UPI00046919DB|nr:hypothetical protein [Sulfurospirillum arcachonense]